MDRENDETIASMAPEVSSPETDETLNVFLEYRLTSMLLALIAAINGPRDDPPQYEPPLERSQSSCRILNALANILVRNTEVVAISANANRPPDNIQQAETLAVFAVEEDDEQEANELPSLSTSLRNFTMVRNTEWSSATVAEGTWFTNVKQGESKWAEIMANPWSQEP
jgi:hypothetical protein